MADALGRLPIRQHGVMPYLWLVYATSVPLSLIGATAPKLVAFQLTLLAAFLVLYVSGYSRRGRTALAYAGGMALLGALASPSGSRPIKNNAERAARQRSRAGVGGAF